MPAQYPPASHSPDMVLVDGQLGPGQDYMGAGYSYSRGGGDAILPPGAAALPPEPASASDVDRDRLSSSYPRSDAGSSSGTGNGTTGYPGYYGQGPTSEAHSQYGLMQSSQRQQQYLHNQQPYYVQGQRTGGSGHAAYNDAARQEREYPVDDEHTGEEYNEKHGGLPLSKDEDDDSDDNPPRAKSKSRLGFSSKQSRKQLASTGVGAADGGTTGGGGGGPGGAKTNVSSIFKGYGTPHQLGYLVTVLVQTIATSILIAIIWVKYKHAAPAYDYSLFSPTRDPETLRRRSITVYLAVFLFGSAFEILTTLDALRLNNTIQLIGVCFFSVAMLVYAALLSGQIQNATEPANGFPADLYHALRPFIWAMPLINGVAALVLAYFTWKLFKDFGWEVLHLLGAGRKMKKRFTAYQIFVCLLKFDFFFFVGFSLQYVILVLSVQEAEFAITLAAFPVTVIFLLLAAFAIRRELSWLTYLMFFVEACGLAYFIFRLYRLFDPSQAVLYEVSRRTLAVFSVLAIAMLLLTFVYTAICWRNFGEGLKDCIPPYWGEHKDTRRKRLARKASTGAQGILDNRESRMSID